MGHTVQETNDNCTVSKYSMVTQGYFKDDFIKLIVPKSKRRCPLINIGYYVRAVIVDSGISGYLRGMESSPCQIVSFGAGFDTTFFRLVSNFKNVKYFEVDLKDVVAAKIKRITSSEVLSSHLINMKESSTSLLSENYCLLAEDIGEIGGLKTSLLAAGLSPHLPTLFLSECAITYLSEEKSRNIISWIGTFQKAAFMIYEQIYPDDGFSEAMLQHYDNLNLPLHSVQYYRTKEDQVSRLKRSGYKWAWSVGAMELYQTLLPPEEHQRALSREPFDEWEEWHLTSAHYTLSIGVSGLPALASHFCLQFLSSLYPRDVLPAPISTCSWELKEDISLQFFGHSLIEIWNGSTVLVIGGVGVSQENKHGRLNQLCFISLPNMKVRYVTPPALEGVRWDCRGHTCSLLADSQDCTDLLLFGGRTSPLSPANLRPVRMSVSQTDVADIHVTGRVLEQNEGPRHRRRHSATSVEGSTFIFGGVWTDPMTKKHTVLADGWVLSSDERWSRVAAGTGPSPRFSHSAAALDGTVFIVGGIGAEREAFRSLSDIWSYNIAGGIWRRLEIPLVARYSQTCHILRPEPPLLLLVGGVNEISEASPGLTLIDLKEHTSQDYGLPSSTRELPILLHNHGSVLTSGPEEAKSQQLIVLGGGGHCFSFGTYFNKHPILIRIP